MKNKYILAIDQGTSSTKTLIVDAAGKVLARGHASLETQYLDGGFVEQDPWGIWENVKASASRCLADLESKGFDVSDISAIGISNQRETFVIWDAEGRPLYPAVVWQCKRSVDICRSLRDAGLEELVRTRTGLVIDPYFSASKIIWLKENISEVREALDKGKAFFGTVDSWLLYCMTDGAVHATDDTNASRTLMFDIRTLQWDEELLEAFGLQGLRLPEVRTGGSFFGTTDLGGLLPNKVPVTGMLGDSHAAAFGEACFSAGDVKATLGTGCSLLMNIGDTPIPSKNGMVTTVCWSTPTEVCYAFEGVIVSCGATLQWAGERLGLFEDPRQTEVMANAVSDSGGVVLVPAFSGLGSPHWQSDRRASITGIGFETTKEHIVRAALESIPYQIKDVIDAMMADAMIAPGVLKADGGITSNRFVMQLLADLLGRPVETIGMPDVSAMGAAFMAGLGAGIFPNMESLRLISQVNNRFDPILTHGVKEGYDRWQDAVQSGYKK
jgi:glycerol kinase